MYKVVIADDEALIRAGLYYRVDWKSMGFEVVALVEDGHDVLEFLEKERVDILLTDICMYQISGLVAADIIQKKYPWMKVVLLSGYREFEYAKQAISCGVYDYLLKPIDYEKLKEVFNNIKQQLDSVKHEEQLLRSFGESEYTQVLRIIRDLSDAALGEGEESLVAYAHLQPMLREAPAEMRHIIIRRLLEILQKKLNMKDEALAREFVAKLQALDVSEESTEDTASELSRVLKKLNDALVSRNLVSSNVVVQDNVISVACNYINNHLQDDFTYRDVATFVHLSPRHFLRRFQNEMGENFSVYVQRIRIEGAMRLLEEEKIMIEDISRLVGYQDDKYFQKIFKKYTGYTMREYRRRRRENIQ